jgi:predicted nucleotidyltransferase
MLKHRATLVRSCGKAKWPGLQLPNLGIIMPKMGRKPKFHAGLASALFSRVQLRVLSLLVGQTDRQFHASEIIRLAGSGSGAVQRELEKLTGAGIVAVTNSGNRKLYRANRESPIFDELHGIIVKTVGLVEPLRQALKPYQSEIDAAFVYGSIAKGKDTARSDIDLLIIGKGIAYSEIYSTLQKAEKTLHRQVNQNLMTKTEWIRKLADKNAFVSKIAQQPKLFVFGTENELQGTG